MKGSDIMMSLIAIGTTTKGIELFVSGFALGISLINNSKGKQLMK